MSDDIPHPDRVLVGLVWLMALLIAGSMAYDNGFGLVESTAIAVVGPPAFVIGAFGSAWVLGTVAIWLNQKLGLTGLIP